MAGGGSIPLEKRVSHPHDAHAKQRVLLLPVGQWSEEGEWGALPPPEDEEVEAVLHRLLRQVRALLAEVEEEEEEEEEETWPEEDLDC